MIENLYRLGKALRADAKYDAYFAPWQNPFDKIDPDNAKVICFHISNGYVVGEFEMEPFRPKAIDKYLFRELAGANAAPLVPTDKLFPAKKEEERRGNILKMISRLERSFAQIPDELTKGKEAVKRILKEVEAQLLNNFQPNTDNRYLVTFKIDGKWLGEYDVLRERLYADAYNKYFEKSAGKDIVCSLTYQKVPEVWGRVDTLGFTVNDPTFSRSGFDERESYKMFPVSPDAVKALEAAKRFAEPNLTWRFSGMSYFVIPHFIEEQGQTVLKAAERLAGIQKQKGGDVVNLSRSILSDEEVLFDVANEKELSVAGISYDLLFYQKNQAQFAIKLHLADILPSRLGRIFEVKRRVERFYSLIGQSKNKEGEIRSLYITFNRIKKFFSTTLEGKSEIIFQPFFFSLMEAVFYGQKVSWQTVLDAFIEQIRLEFKQRNDPRGKSNYGYTTRECFILWHFFMELGLFDHQNTFAMGNKIVSRSLEEFIEQHPAFFNEPYKRAAFLTGCLVEVLLKAQRKRFELEVGKEPFLQKLGALNFNEKDLRSVFTQANEKILQYVDELEKWQFYIKKLNAQIAPLLMEPTSVGRNEISFAFTAGMVLQRSLINPFGSKAVEDDELEPVETEEDN